MSPTNLSRRGLLRAASSVAAASTVVALPIAAFPAAAAPVTSDTSDAELLALGEKLKPLLVEEFNLRPKYDRAYQRASDAGGYMKSGARKTARRSNRPKPTVDLKRNPSEVATIVSAQK